MPSELIPLAGIALPVAIVGTILITKHQARKRELAHLERMQALRMGVSPEPRGHAWKAVTCSSIAAGVPMVSFFTAWMASLTTHHSHEEAWFVASVVSLVAIISGGRLARTLLLPPSLPESPAPAYQEAAYSGKPQGDPDLYDVAGRRG